MNITAKSSKADIIDAAVELTDTQAERISVLEQELKTALWIAGLTAVWALLF